MNEQEFFRFAAKTEISGQHLIWTGAHNGRGYGRLCINGRMQYVHRLSYEHWVGPIPEGLVIDHLCRIPGCCAPNCLEAVTQSENMRRGDVGKYTRTPPAACPKGHPYTVENTGYQWWRRKYRTRYCRICVRAKSRRSNTKRRTTGEEAA